MSSGRPPGPKGEAPVTPNFVPRDLLTEPMEIAATLNPVTVMLVLNVRMIQRYD